ncbi:adenylate/guanylate cyclase domain-containing protein [Geitlerinema sp. PCC 9228]|jgi:PAS domain S-box-containing protein|uniref:adenylate/guanylate cyclase domain-containing protein n=1 Tax=Geitlerinema sp. PCC 9228 TaxID=111611 RepID=UPI0008F98AE2|nr:adenylate/guanylate cyclase domain-containing protein [Geitlerinema sp. PCC 9228]
MPYLSQESQPPLRQPNTQNQWAIETIVGIRLGVEQLRETTPQSLPSILQGMSESEYLQRCQQQQHYISIVAYHLLKAQLLYLYGHFQNALAAIREASQFLDRSDDGFFQREWTFYRALILLALYPDMSLEQQNRTLEEISAHQQQMQVWLESDTSACQCQYLLIAAEKARRTGDRDTAIDRYDEAIAAATEANLYFQAGLAAECATEFWLGWQKPKIARVYLQEAYRYYQQWGTTAKLEYLETQYQNLLTASTQKQSTTKQQKEWDLTTVMNASRAISGEIVLEKLLGKLMQMLLDHVGAETGCLLLADESGNLQLAVRASSYHDSEVIYPPISPDRNTLPLSLLYQAYRTHQLIWHGNASEELEISPGHAEATPSQEDPTNIHCDPYLRRQQPTSVLCLPLLNQGRPIGVIYLENNQTVSAFQSQQVEMLHLLSSQAAVALDNAMLYSQLHDSQSRLTQFLEAMPLGVLVVDGEGTPYLANHAAQQIFGKGIVENLSLQEMSRTCGIYLAGTKQLYPAHRMPLMRALAGEATSVTDMEVHQSGRTIPLEVRGIPIFDDRGEVSYAIAVFQDISERTRAEADRAQFTEELCRLNEAYERFVPDRFLEFLNKESIVDVQLGDQTQREMSVLFADIRDFTTLSETMTPEENFRFINSYLSSMEPSIIENQGVVDKFIGDAIMALFGSTNNADDSVHAAIAMLNRLSEYNQGRQRAGYQPIQVGIGINTGSLMLGTVGGHNRMDSTVIGDAVNLASRLEGLTKIYGVSLLISHQTFAHLQNPGEYSIRIIERLKVRGKTEPVAVFEVFDGDDPNVKAGKLATVGIFEQGLFSYYRHAWQEAADLFQACVRLNPEDRVAQIYLERCRQELAQA